MSLWCPLLFEGSYAGLCAAMRRDIGAVVFAVIASLGMCVASVSGARGDSHLPLMRAKMGGVGRNDY